MNPSCLTDTGEDLPERFTRLMDAQPNVDELASQFAQTQLDKTNPNILTVKRTHEHEIPDVAFKCQNVRFLCKKENLARESDSFKEMFSLLPDCQEFDIKHYRPQIVGQFLLYVGTSQFDDHQLTFNDWEDLLALAHQFKFPLMERVCEHNLGSNLDLLNALDTLQFAMAHDMAFLQNFTIDFMKSNWSHFESCPLLSELAQVYPQLTGLDSSFF